MCPLIFPLKENTLNMKAAVNRFNNSMCESAGEILSVPALFNVNDEEKTT